MATITRKSILAEAKRRAPDSPKEVRDPSFGSHQGQALILRRQPASTRHRKGHMALYVQLRRGKRVRVGVRLAGVVDGTITWGQVQHAIKEAFDPETESTDPTKPQRWTLRRYLDELYGPWVVERRRSGQATLARLHASCVPILGDIELTALRDEIEDWKSARLKVVKPSTMNRDLATLKAAIGQAVESWPLKTGLKVNPLAGVRMVKVPKKSTTVTRALTDKEQRNLLHALDVHDQELADSRGRANVHRRTRRGGVYPSLDGKLSQLTVSVITAIDSGLRRREQFLLKWCDIDFRAGHIRLDAENAKTFEERDVPMSKRLRDTLNQWRAQRLEQGCARPEDHVFTNRHGQPLQNLKKSFTALLKKAGIPQRDKNGRVSWRSLRNTFATNVAKGADRDVLRRLLGHAEGSKVTDKYISVEAKRLKNAIAETLDAT